MNIFKLFFLLFTLLINTYAKNIEPLFTLKSKGFVNDFIFEGEKLFVANDEGSVEIFDLRSRKLITEIKLEPILTTKQEWQNVKILSVDVSNGKILIVTSTNTPYRDVWLHDGVKLKQIIKAEDKTAIKEARFVDDDKFIFGTLGYEMILYNISDNYSSYKKHVEQSSFEDLVVSEDKKTMVTSCESGQVTLSDVKSGKVLKLFKPLNLDKVYQIAYKNGTVITAGQDRKVAVFPKNSQPYVIKSDFLVYSVALSPSAKIGLYSSNSNSDLQLFNVKTGKKMETLVGQHALPTVTKFYDENRVFSAGYENKIYVWKID
ncbi:MAG: nitrate reductase [Helicobacteraceae bacterium]|nr:nitrate reductase [Helicobacteraceae bacterium]